jgi:shikimate kinase
MSMPPTISAALPLPAIEKPVVFVGLMGVGKTSVGKRFAARAGLDFIDADAEIERAAGLSIPDIFAVYGEAAFRDCEKRVIARLLDGPPRVVATGGGAFVNAETRALIKEKAVSIWLNAPVSLLVERVARRQNRPLLANTDPAAVLARLAAEREPFYREADIAVESGSGPHEKVVDAIFSALTKAHIVTESQSR